MYVDCMIEEANVEYMETKDYLSFQFSMFSKGNNQFIPALFLVATLCTCILLTYLQDQNMCIKQCMCIKTEEMFNWSKLNKFWAHTSFYITVYSTFSVVLFLLGKVHLFTCIILKISRNFVEIMTVQQFLMQGYVILDLEMVRSFN